jgi:glycogen synthase
LPARIALVSRELYPFGGGGIGEYVAACAALLSEIGDVTVFTSSSHEQRYRDLHAERDPRIDDRIEVVFVPEPSPEEVGGYFSLLHAYSARVLEALRERYRRDGPPDLVEFSDYLGEGAVTVQAQRAHDPLLRDAVTAVRLHSSAEVCALLDGYVEDELEARMTCELERMAIRLADHVIWPGGDTYPFYQRFYGADQVAPGFRIYNPALDCSEEPETGPDSADGELRLLYLGRLERRKGVENLVRAVTFTDSQSLRLALLGGDTPTAPLGKSMRAQLELVAEGDDRISFLDPVPRTELDRLIQSADAVILPSLWEAWPYVGLETLRLNRPILATPVGGFTGIVRHGVNGWLAKGTEREAVAQLIADCLFGQERLAAMRDARGPARSFEQLTDPASILDGYRRLLGKGESGSRGRGVRRRRAPDPDAGVPVSVVIPYYRLEQHVEEAVVSALEQTHGTVEVLVVNDGSFREADRILWDLERSYPISIVSQVNSGLGAARNFGIGQARGRFVVPLDADNLLEPSFVERTLSLALARPELAFVTSWSRYIDEEGVPLELPNEGYQPFGNMSSEVMRDNIAGDAIALIRRRVFDDGFWYSEDLTSFEDWDFYRQLHVAGRFGIAIPERLIKYRVRRDSMIRQIGFRRIRRLAGELEAHRREREVRWTHSSA